MRFTTIKQMPLVIGILVPGRQAALRPVLFITVPHTKTAGILKGEIFDADAHTMTIMFSLVLMGRLRTY